MYSWDSKNGKNWNFLKYLIGVGGGSKVEGGLTSLSVGYMTWGALVPKKLPEGVA